jgi:hypothetical protein
VPLFTPATLMPAGDVRIATAIQPAQAEDLRAVGVDEYRMYVYTVEPAGQVAFYRVDTGALANSVAVPGLGTATVTSSSRRPAAVRRPDAQGCVDRSPRAGPRDPRSPGSAGTAGFLHRAG